MLAAHWGRTKEVELYTMQINTEHQWARWPVPHKPWRTRGKKFSADNEESFQSGIQDCTVVLITLQGADLPQPKQHLGLIQSTEGQGAKLTALTLWLLNRADPLPADLILTNIVRGPAGLSTSLILRVVALRKTHPWELMALSGISLDARCDARGTFLAANDSATIAQWKKYDSNDAAIADRGKRGI